MGRSFDDLFNEFFGKKRNNVNSINDELRKIIDSLMSFKMTQNQMMEEAIQEELGEPDEIIDHIEGGMNFRKLVWNTPAGKFVKIVVTDVQDAEPIKPKKAVKEKSLEEQLKEAVEVENYELAIQLRDQIKKNKRANTRKKKKDE